MQLGFYFDQSKCVGCKACQIACADKNALPVGTFWRHVVEYGGGSWTQDGDVNYPQGMFAYFTSLSCNHCENAICVDACPTTAIRKNPDNGIVTIDEGLCIGCRYCQWVCPYGAPSYDADKSIVTKCDFCIDEIEAGRSPYCVIACPMLALDYGDMDELRAKYGDGVDTEPLPPSDVTKPGLIVKPHPQAQASGRGTGRIIDMEGEN